MNEKLSREAADEIRELHDGVVAWISGEAEESDETFGRLFGDRFDDDFLLVAPAGRRLSVDALRGFMRGAHGSNSDFRIKITDVRVIHATDDHVLATCLMWQRGAKNSDRPENGRVLTASMVPDGERPGGFRWTFTHESWLPDEEMAAADYDF